MNSTINHSFKNQTIRKKRNLFLLKKRGHRRDRRKPFVELSALTNRESNDIVTQEAIEASRAGENCTLGGNRARSLLREILSPPRAKLPEFVGAIERMEDLVRRFCGRRDAQGLPHTIADDIRMSSLESSSARRPREACTVESYEIDVVRCLDKKRPGSTCDYTGHARSSKPKVTPRPAADDPIDMLVHSARAKVRPNVGESKDSKTRLRTDKDQSKDSILCWI